MDRCVSVFAWGIGIFFVVLLLGTLFGLIAASDAGAQIGNSEKHEGWWALGLLVGALAWLALWAVPRYLTPLSHVINRLNRKTSWRAGVILCFLWMCAFPPLYYWGMDRIFPAVLGTRDGFVRITSTGEMMLPGTVVSTDRFERSSKVVPTNVRTAVLQFDGMSRNGFTTRVTANVEYQVRQGEELRQILFGHYDDIPYLTSGYGSADSQNYHFLSDEVAEVLRPVIDRTLGELAVHPTNGAPSELTIRSRTAAEGSLPALPPWLMYIRVSNITVESWEKH